MTDPTQSLTATLDTLAKLDETITDSDIREISYRLKLAYAIQDESRRVIEMISEHLAPSMEDDEMTITGVGTLARRPRYSSTWLNDSSREEMYADAITAIVRRVATDPMTGEVHPPLNKTVREAWKLILEVFSFSADPKVAFRKTLGLQPDEYRAKRKIGHTVTIKEETL